jgi:hypothetical protein
MQGYAPLDPPASVLPDRRLLRRLEFMVQRFAQQPERSIPQATGNRNDMDAAYDFFKNPRVVPAGVVASCLPQAVQGLGECRRVLAIQDGCDFNFSGLKGTSGLGYTDGPGGRGLKMHSSLAVTAGGQPLGLLTQQIWAREPRRKGRARGRRLRPAQDKESYRWQDHAQAARAALPAEVTVVHVADREGDVYGWLAAPRPAHTHLLVRVAQARRVVVHGPDEQRGHLAEVVRAAAVLGRHTITVPRADDRPSRPATLAVRVAAVSVQPPRNAPRRGQLRPVPVWAVEAYEESPLAGSQAICWRLLTTEPVETWEQALRVLREYALRWLIERLHYVIKSGCRVEQLQLEAAERLANALAVYSQVAARVLRLLYLSRQQPEAPAAAEFSPQELAVLGGYQRQQARGRPVGPVQTLAQAVALVGRLGGHLGRKGDGPPGAKVLWRGLQALHDMVLGYRIGQTNYPPPTPLIRRKE